MVKHRQFLKLSTLYLSSKIALEVAFLPQNAPLAFQVIKVYHGQEGGFDTNGCSFKGIWANIVGTSIFIHSKGPFGILVTWSEVLVPNGTFKLRMARYKYLTKNPSHSCSASLGINKSPGKVNVVYVEAFPWDRYSLIELNLSSRASSWVLSVIGSYLGMLSKEKEKTQLAFKFAGLAYLYAKVFSFGIFVGFEDGSSFHPLFGVSSKSIPK
ncbi:hypothetical protein Tco_0780939 [Tanacetum coccineum]